MAKSVGCSKQQRILFFSVDKRSVRDHIGALMQRFKRKEAKELKESGTTPTKTELDAEATEQIIAMEESVDKQHEGKDGGRQAESRRDAPDCYVDIRENTEEKV